MIPNTPENQAKIDKVAEDIIGTSDSLDSVLQRVFEDDELTIESFDIGLLERLDDAVFECTGCGWWVETSEVEDELCSQCQDDG